MIVLKHLAREFDVPPPKLRKLLRTKFGLQRSWRWNDVNDKHYRKVHAYLCTVFPKIKGEPNGKT